MYFQKIRDIERSIAEPFPVVISLETPEGGKAGVATEVSREIAARFVTDGKVRLATEDERSAFHAESKAALAAAEEALAASKIQFTVVHDHSGRSGKNRNEKG
jgi:D-serine deaminase-like pyridoxal phosphate-dependent protein